MTFRQVYPLSLLLLACAGASAQSPGNQPLVAIEASSTGLVVRVNTGDENGAVLLQSSGRVLGYRPLKNGEARWNRSDLPLGTYLIQASYKGNRSQPLAYRGGGAVVTGLSAANTLDSAPKHVKGLATHGRGIEVLSDGKLFAISQDIHGHSHVAQPLVGALSGSAVLADFDGDGIADMASAEGGHVEVMLTGKRGGPAVVENRANPVQLAAGDFDGDGIADLVIADTTTGEIRMLKGAADGLGTAVVARPSTGASVHIAVEDLNADGRCELLVADATAQRISVLQAATGGWAELATYPAGGSPVAISAGDFNGSGSPVAVWLNNDGSIHIAGRPAAAGSVEPGALFMTAFVTAADMDGDGRTDVVVANETGVRVLYGVGDSGAGNSGNSNQVRLQAQACSSSTVVTNSGDSGCSGTLRYVVTHAAAGATVTFASGLSNVSLSCNDPSVADCTIVVPAGVSINGNGQNQTVISAVGSTRIFLLQGNSKISNLTLSDGQAKGGSGADGYTGGGGAAGMGGAVFVMGTGNQFQNVSFTGNYANGGNGGNSNTASNPYIAGGGGGGLGGNGGQGHHGSGLPPFYEDFDSGGDGGPGGILGGNGGVGGHDLNVDFGKIGSVLVALISIPFLQIPETLEEVLILAGRQGLNQVGKLSLNAILNYYGVNPDQTFSTQPTEGGPGGGGGGAPYGIPLGLAGGYGGGGGGSADPYQGYGGRSIFGGGAGGGGDTGGVGLGGSGYGGAVFVYQGASANFDGCSFTNNHAAGGFIGTKDGSAVNTLYPSQSPGFGGAVYIDTGGQVSYNPATGIQFSNNGATQGIFSWGGPWNQTGTGVAIVFAEGNTYKGEALNQAIQGVAPGTTICFSAPGTINVTSPITISKSLVIDGQNQITINGGNNNSPLTSQLFLIAQGNVSFRNLTLANGVATGGSGAQGAFGGGGGAGAGGAIFIHAGNVSVTNVTFSGNIAVGGIGGPGGLGGYPDGVTYVNYQGGGGGGGLTAAGGLASYSAAGGGGQSFLTGLGDPAPYSNIPCTGTDCIHSHGRVHSTGIYEGGAGGLDNWRGFNGDDGNMFGGGGGAGICVTSNNFDSVDCASTPATGIGGNGGYGAGGGAGNPAGKGGKFGGDGQNQPSLSSYGGGGAGLGGAIYLRTGTLTIDSCVFSNNSAQGDRFRRVNSGQGKAGAIFNQAGTINWKGASTFQGNSAANAGNSPLDNNDIYGAIANFSPISNAPTANIPILLPPLTAGPSPQGIVARDVNGDSIPDLVVETATAVLVFPGVGDGTFGSPVSTPINGLHQNGSTYTLPFAGLATGYLYPIIANPGVTILTAQQSGVNLLAGGQGSGPLAPTSAAALAVGDIDNDGFDDYVTVGADSGGITVVLSTTHAGAVYNFAPFAPVYGPVSWVNKTQVGQYFNIASCGAQPFSAVTIGDFDGNGLNDIAAAGPDCVLVAYNSGGGAFDIQSNRGPLFSFGAAPVTSIAPVVTPDGNVSFFVTAAQRFSTSTLTSVVVGHTFNSAGEPVFAPVTFGLTAGAATVGDFNRDGTPDLLVTYPATNKASLYLGSSVPSLACMNAVTSTFSGCSQSAPLATWNLPATPVAVTSADFNGDGYADFAIATADGNVSILMGRAPLNVAVQRAVQNVTVGDIVNYTAAVTDFANLAGTLSVALTTTAQAGIINAGGVGWQCSPAPVVCTSAVTSGGPAPGPITFQVAADAFSSTLTATAVATLNGLYPGQGSDSATVSVALSTVQLTLLKTSPFLWPQEPGVAYTASLSNAGTTAVTGAFSVAISLPKGISAYNISGSGWTCTSTPVACTRTGTLAAGAALPPINIPLTIANVTAGTVTTTGTASVSGSNPITVNDTFGLLASVPVTILSSSVPNPLGYGQQGATFHFFFNRPSGLNLTGATFAIQADPSVQIVSLDGQTGTTRFQCALATNSCTLPSDSGSSTGSQAGLNIGANIAGDAPPLINVTATFTLSGPQLSQTLSVPVLPPSLGISMSHAGFFQSGGQAAWSIAVQNTGRAQSNAVVQVTDVLPPGLTAVTMSGAGWNCSAATNTCSRGGGLNPGLQYPAINVTGTIPANSGASLTNSATLSWPGGSPATVSDTASVSTPPPSGTPSLTATIIKSETSPASPPNRQWSVKLTNGGTGAATGVQITAANITLQAGLGTGPVTLLTPLPVSVPDIPAGGSATVPLVLSFPVTTPVTVVQLQLTVAANGPYSKTIVFNSQLR